jgi:hypothetical protein
MEQSNCREARSLARHIANKKAAGSGGLPLLTHRLDQIEGSQVAGTYR